MAGYRLSRFIGSISLLLVLAPSAALADGTLDQAFEPDPTDGIVRADIENSSRAETSAAQSFTVGQAGVLSCVEVFANGEHLDAGDLILEIQTTNAGAPDGGVLASVSIPRSDVPDELSYLRFDVSDAAIAVSVGDVLAIVLMAEFRTIEGLPWDYSWMGEAAPRATYPGGFASSRLNGVWTSLPSVDLGFRTYVDSPTPVVAASWGEIKHNHLSARKS